MNLHSTQNSNPNVASPHVANSLDLATLNDLQKIVVDIGTRTYDRFDYAMKVLQDVTAEPDIYTCSHMCRDLNLELTKYGIANWPIVGLAQTGGRDFSHPAMVVKFGERFYFFDMAFGMLQPVAIDRNGTIETADKRFEIVVLGSNVVLIKSSEGLSFKFTFDTSCPRSNPEDPLHLRRINFPTDDCTLMYRNNTAGQLLAMVAFVHQDPKLPSFGKIIIRYRDPENNRLVSYAHAASQSMDGAEGRALLAHLTHACEALAKDSIQVEMDLRYLRTHVNRLVSLQAELAHCGARSVTPLDGLGDTQPRDD